MQPLIQKKLTLLLPSLRVGGAEKVLVALANYFSARMSYVELVVREGGPLEEELDPRVALHVLSASNYRTYIMQLSVYFDTYRPDYLITSIYITGICALIARLLAKYKPRILVGAHNLFSAKVASPDNIKDKYLLAPLARMFLPLADAIVCVSHGVAEDLLRHANVQSAKLHVIYNPVIPLELERLKCEPLSHEWLESDRSEATIVTVCRLVPQKGVDTLLRAFALITSVDTKLIIIGDGPERDSLKRLVSELQIESRVDFIGLERNPFKYLARCDLFVMSSRWEGFGNTLAEALACGCPVVATDCQSGPAEILENGALGRLVPVDNPDRLAESICDALCEERNDVEKLRRIHRAQMFSLDSAGARYFEVLQSMDIVN